MTFTQMMSSSVQHYQPQSPGRLLDEGDKGEGLCNQIEERSSQSCHTSFPVNLKEVFELTSPSSDLNQALLRQSSDIDAPSPGYPSPPDLSAAEKQQPQQPPNCMAADEGQKEPPWSNSVLEKLDGSENHVASAQIPEAPWPGVFKDGSEDRSKLEPQSVVNLSVSDERMSYGQPGSPPHALKNQGSDADASGQQLPWGQVQPKGSRDGDLGSKEQVRDENHVVINVCGANGGYIPPSHLGQCHSSRLQEGKQPPRSNRLETWDYPANPVETNDRTILVPVTSSSGSFAKRDASCQVDDMSLGVASGPAYRSRPVATKQNGFQGSRGSPPSSDLQMAPHTLLNLSVGTETQPAVTHQGMVHSGIKPELYTQERNLVVESRTKDQVSTKKSGCFSCHRCPKSFGDSRSLQRHMMVHAGLRAYRCPVCDKGFMLKGDLTRHIRIHSGEKPFACEVCGRRFTLKGNLMQHFRTHSPDKQYACTICSKNYAQKDSLHRHIRAHFGEKPFQCATCGKKFTLKGDLSRHILIHSGVKPHNCKICGKMFALKGNLTQHMRTHIKHKMNSTSTSTAELFPQSIDSQKCSDGGPTLQKAHVYDQNVTFMHGDVSVPNTSAVDRLVSSSLFVPASSSGGGNQLQSAGLSFCSACSKTFSTPESLQDHVQLVHEQSTRLTTNRYLCNVCRKEFTLKGDLTRHLNSHNGVKPYQCEHCEKTFTLKSNLRQHLTTHTSDKCFPCPLCSKLFGNRRNLSLHLRRHEQASANFTCTRCGRSFLAKSDHFFHNCVKMETSSSSSEAPVIKVPAVAAFPAFSQHQQQQQQQQAPAVVGASGYRGTVASSLPNDASHSSSADASYLFSVKREGAHCGTRPAALAAAPATSGPENLTLNGVSGTETFISPFYRHLYFATSHQGVLPSLKGFLSSQSETNSISDSNKTVKAN